MNMFLQFKNWLRFGKPIFFFAVSQNYHEHMQYLANTYHYDIVGEFAIPQPLARVAVVADRFHHQLAVVSKTKIGVY